MRSVLWIAMISLASCKHDTSLLGDGGLGDGGLGDGGLGSSGSQSAVFTISGFSSVDRDSAGSNGLRVLDPRFEATQVACSSNGTLCVAGAFTSGGIP